MRNAVVLLFVALACVGAFYLAGRLRPEKERDASFAERRAALLAGTARGGAAALPLAVLELHGAQGRRVLFAGYADGAFGRLEGDAGNPVRQYLHEPAGERGRATVEPFFAELRAVAAAGGGASADDSAPGTATLHLPRDGALRPVVVAPLEAVRGGAHPLSALDRAARAVNDRLAWRSVP